jgi:ubiquinone/menaquinone biosynthesis C-methylase UbiE
MACTAGGRSRLSRLAYLLFIEPLLAAAKRMVLAMVRSLRADSVVEVGCGTCTQALMLARAGIAVTAVDISERMFPASRSPRLPGNLRFFQADGRSLPLADGSYDAALISMSLHEMGPDARLPVLREMARTVKDRGRLLVMDFSFDLRRDWNWAALLIRLIEWMAGREHNGNMRHFLAAGGLPGLAGELGWPVRRHHRVLNGNGSIFELEIRKPAAP